MTKQEWKQRCTARILREVQKAGRIRIRNLKRATHYNRGPRDDEGMGLSLEIWFDALEHLERVKAIVIETDDYDNPVWIMTPLIATALRECGVSPVKRMSPVVRES